MITNFLKLGIKGYYRQSSGHFVKSYGLLFDQEYKLCKKSYLRIPVFVPFADYKLTSKV